MYGGGVQDPNAYGQPQVPPSAGCSPLFLYYLSLHLLSRHLRPSLMHLPDRCTLPRLSRYVQCSFRIDETPHQLTLGSRGKPCHPLSLLLGTQVACTMGLYTAANRQEADRPFTADMVEVLQGLHTHPGCNGETLFRTSCSRPILFSRRYSPMVQARYQVLTYLPIPR